MNTLNFKKSSIILSIFSSSLILGCSSSSDDNSAVNTVPSAQDDVLIVDGNSQAGSANRVTVSNNDDIGDNGGDGDDYSISNYPVYGDVTEISDGVIQYIPYENYSGSDSFTYTLSDADGDETTATVSITVNEIDSQDTTNQFNNMDPNLPSFVSISDTTPSGKAWVKLDSMSDEFDSWDSSKWFKSSWNYGVPVFMSTSDENSGVTNGNLWLKATLNENNPDDRWFQTARIHSKAETKYPMYTEARIKTSHLSAYTTYWLNNGDINDRDEIDIIENNSNPSCGCKPEYPNQMNSQYFQADSNQDPQTVRQYGNFLRSDLSDANPLKDVGWNEDYHIYGVWWQDANNLQFYLNGEPAGKVSVGEHLDGNTYDREFTRDLEIIFDLWTSDASWVGGLPEKSELANDDVNTAYIDWVRTWKLEDQ